MDVDSVQPRPMKRGTSMRKLIDFCVAEHNATMPHSAFRGQTPDEMYFGRGETVPDKLALKRREAQRLRIEQNRNIACAECPRGVTTVGEDVAA